MPLDSKVRELLTKTKVFFVGNGKQLRENLSPRSIKLASIAEAVIPFGATLAYMSWNQGERPPYNLDEITSVLAVDGALRLLLPPITKKYNELWDRYAQGTSFEEMKLLEEPTGLVGKARDAVYIYFRLLGQIKSIGSDNFPNH
ncbi:hypothetical protein HYV80_01775 [Candidatus Woesearchaeota archaeon]|nr:hypothetical protein [Candidatus Woesearchaeota archaeon]